MTQINPNDTINIDDSCIDNGDDDGRITPKNIIIPPSVYNSRKRKRYSVTRSMLKENPVAKSSRTPQRDINKHSVLLRNHYFDHAKKKLKISDEEENNIIVILSDDDDDNNNIDVLKSQSVSPKSPSNTIRSPRKSSLKNKKTPDRKKKKKLRKRQLSSMPIKRKSNIEKNEKSATVIDDDVEVIWSSAHNDNKTDNQSNKNVRKNQTKSTEEVIFWHDPIGSADNLRLLDSLENVDSFETGSNNSPKSFKIFETKINNTTRYFSVSSPKKKKASKRKRKTRWNSVDKVQTIPEVVQHKNTEQPKKLREIIVDGSNVAMSHTNGRTFSLKGIQLVIEYFVTRGHKIKVFVPQSRRSPDRNLLEKWYKQGIVVFTPSRKVGSTRITPYDDRYILEYATKCDGIVVSSDQFQDLWMESTKWRNTIKKNLLPQTFVDDYVMFPQDPLGIGGPTLDEFLQH